MRCRFVSILLLSMLALGVSASGHAARARAAFGVTLTIVVACTTVADDSSGSVHEHCSYPRPCRVSVTRAQPAPQARRITQMACGNVAVMEARAGQPAGCGAGANRVNVTVYY